MIDIVAPSTARSAIRGASATADDTSKAFGMLCCNYDSDEEDFVVIQAVSGSSTNVVDIGGGRFDNAVEDLAKQDVELQVYDPFNRTPDHNNVVKELVADGGADVAVSNNTLNVIKEPKNIKRVIQQAENAIKPGDKAYFTVYAGDKSGKGKTTSKGYQRNEPTSAYVSRVEEVFGEGNVQSKGDLITATKSNDMNRGGLMSRT